MTGTTGHGIKLSDALALRAHVQKEQGELTRTIQSHLVVAENEKPEDDDTANTLIERYTTISIQLRELIVAINATNLATPLGDGTITSAIAERDRLTSLLGMLRTTKSNSVLHTPRKTITTPDGKQKTVKNVLVFNPKSLQAEVRRVEKIRTQLDMELQRANHATSLIADEDSPLWELVAAARESEDTSQLRSIFDKQPSVLRSLFSRG